ncbi:MAG: hypothetical protein GY820_20075 [Gammaproteobacteria bacterium]|nr:hypothetical protein [Gammaproteobacteria bacterium]
MGRHVSAVHRKLRPHQCEECGQKFSRKSSLNNHQLQLHRGGPRTLLHCAKCTKSFTNRGPFHEYCSVRARCALFKCQLCSLSHQH